MSRARDGTEARTALCALWIETLYTRLTAAEHRAADPDAPPPVQRAATATAWWIAAQIEHYEAELRRLHPEPAAPPDRGAGYH